MSLDIDRYRQQAVARRRFDATLQRGARCSLAIGARDNGLGVASGVWRGASVVARTPGEIRHRDRRRRTCLVSPKPHRRSTVRFELSAAGAQRDGGPPSRGRVGVDLPDSAAWEVDRRAWARRVLAIAAESIGVAGARPKAAARHDELWTSECDRVRHPRTARRLALASGGAAGVERGEREASDDPAGRRASDRVGDWAGSLVVLSNGLRRVGGRRLRHWRAHHRRRVALRRRPVLSNARDRCPERHRRVHRQLRGRLDLVRNR